MGATTEEEQFDRFMDAYQQKENEILEERKKMYTKYQGIRDLNGKEEYLELDMNRYKMHYLGWTLASVIIIIYSTRIFK